MIAELAPGFRLLTFQDADTGTELQYQRYIPTDYDENTAYPPVMFIPDSGAVGKGADAVLTQGWGGPIRATETEQTKHPAFVLVPVFTETIVEDNFNHSSQIDVAIRLVQRFCETYSTDTNRICTTGQSMGGMTSFYPNTACPDLFAASIFVGSQWDNSVLNVLEDRNFFCIVGAGDPKTSTGQTGLMEVFGADGAAYRHAERSAQDDADTQNAAVAAMLAEGNNACFIAFAEGSTFTEGQTATTAYDFV